MSCPAVLASGPSCPHPVIRAYTSRGFRAAHTSGPKPSRSATPGRNASTSTSAWSASRSSTSTPAGFFRSSRIERLLRWSGSVGGSACRPVRSGRSTRSTSAPRSARTMQPNGAGARLATSTTLTPCNGPNCLPSTAPLLVTKTLAGVRGAGVGEAGERLEVGQVLAALDAPGPFPADRRGEADLEGRVEVVVGVGEHAAEHPVDLVRGHRRQRLAAHQVDVAHLVGGEVDPVHPRVALQQELVEPGVV